MTAESLLTLISHLSLLVSTLILCLIGTVETATTTERNNSIFRNYFRESLSFGNTSITRKGFRPNDR